MDFSQIKKPLKCKTHYKGISRRFTFRKSDADQYDVFKEFIRKLYGFGKEFTMVYKDHDKIEITFSSQTEFEEMWRLYNERDEWRHDDDPSAYEILIITISDCPNSLMF